MYAIVDIAGQQVKVQKDQNVFVNRLAGKEGDKVQFDHVLLIDNDGSVTVGAPAIKGAAVTAKITEHLKGDKVIVFKKKRRKGYKKKNGHRQYLTSIKIDSIVATGAKAAAPAKEEKKAAPAPKKEAAPKAAAPKAAAPKKEAAPKAAKADDLKKIEGIGPKIAETLTAGGVGSFAELASTSSEKISEIIAEVRGNHVTDTWPQQAQMAADGKWDELKKWQDEMDGGKPTE
jgi:large subunit ribosomal protein L21